MLSLTSPGANLQRLLSDLDSGENSDDRYSVVPYRRKYFNDELFDLIDRDIQKARDYYRGDEGDEESGQQGTTSLHTSQGGRKGGQVRLLQTHN